MKRSATQFAGTILAALTLGCASLPTADPVAPPKALRGADAAAADQLFTEKRLVGGRPGSQKNLARTYSTQPPLIPHALDYFDEVTLEENQCLTCHGPGAYQKKNAPLIGESHFVAKNKAQGLVSMAYHACVMCHVAQVDAPALVDTTFQGDRTVQK